MRFATSRLQPASIYAHGNKTWQQSCGHSTAICNPRFQITLELRTQKRIHNSFKPQFHCGKKKAHKRPQHEITGSRPQDHATRKRSLWTGQSLRSSRGTTASWNGIWKCNVENLDDSEWVLITFESEFECGWVTFCGDYESVFVFSWFFRDMVIICLANWHLVLVVKCYFFLRNALSLLKGLFIPLAVVIKEWSNLYLITYEDFEWFSYIV